MPRLDQRLGFTRYEADAAYRRALEAYRKGDFDAALDLLNAALDAQPGRSELLAARGLVYLEDGEKDRARADFEAALKAFPYEMLAHYGLGALAYREGRWEQALDHFTHALYIDQARGETLYYLALTHYQLKNYPQAQALMQRALERLDAAHHKGKTDAARWLRELSRQMQKDV
jgi:tetratricopeptide (TPR) repeat protein